MRIEGAERTVTNTETGVLIEISSDDAAVAEEIQARFAERDDKDRTLDVGKRRGRHGPGKRHGRRGPGGFGLMRPIEGAERTVTNLDNGVRIEITSEDPEIVQTVQEGLAESPPGPWCPHGPKGTEAVPEEGDVPPEAQVQE